MPALAEGPALDLRPRRRGDGGRHSATTTGLAEMISSAKLGGNLGYVVADAETGIVLEAAGADEPMPLASTAKVVTTLYGLMMLGAGHRFVTRVLATGPLVGGQIQGDLVLQGSGDPVLDTDMLGDLVARLAVTGLRGVTGRFLVVSGALPNVDQIDAEQPDFVGYDPAISGLNLNFNRVYFEWKRANDGWQTNVDARGERFMPRVMLARVAVVNRESPLFTYAQSAGREDWTVASAALGKGGSRWLPVRNPAAYAAEVFATLAKAQGITLPSAEVVQTSPGGTEIGRHESKDLGPILHEMLRFSTNLTAEVVGLSSSGAPDLAASGAAMTRWLGARHGIAAAFTDHSGLGAGSRISAAAMTKALVAARNDTGSGGLLPSLLKDVGMRDDAGKVVKGHPARVLAKTGTLNFASGLVGYILQPAGRPLAFAIYASDLDRRAALTEEEREDPPGGSAWLKRARRLQGGLVARWAELYA
jgi:D-alanyl-D-alanine carboxypeptidase/D-alanyl-D-alanine-endopeptidase (penicillin-binding protein 4)